MCVFVLGELPFGSKEDPKEVDHLWVQFTMGKPWYFGTSKARL